MFRLCYLLFRSQAAKTGFDPKWANNLLGMMHEGVEEDICQSRQEDSSVTLELT